MTSEQRLQLEENVVKMLRTVFDPEIPVDIYSLGPPNRTAAEQSGPLTPEITLTAPKCPAPDLIIEDARIKLESIDGISSVTINLVFEPEWNKDMMSEEAKLELGFL